MTTKKPTSTPVRQDYAKKSKPQPDQDCGGGERFALEMSIAICTAIAGAVVVAKFLQII
jgi:hypothetical protein